MFYAFDFFSGIDMPFARKNRRVLEYARRLSNKTGQRELVREFVKNALATMQIETWHKHLRGRLSVQDKGI